MGSVPGRTLIRIGQAAEILGVSVETIRRWESEGRLPVSRSAELAQECLGHLAAGGVAGTDEQDPDRALRPSLRVPDRPLGRLRSRGSHPARPQAHGLRSSTSPLARKTTSSAMFVARSPIRSR